MNTRPSPLTVAVWSVVAVLALAACQNSSASVIHAPPALPCHQENRMDLVITDEGVWFECVCEYLQIGVVCDWYELGPAPDATAARRRLWKYVSPATQRVLMLRHPWPRYLSLRRITKPAVKVVAGTTGGVVTTTGKCTNPYLADDAWAQAHGC